ncbi:MAG: DinB family protein [Gemmatimonadaceae bacterium]
MKLLAVVLIVMTPALGAQSARHAPSAPVVTGVRDLWQITIENVLAAAQQMPESSYSFKPTPEVRSFGQVINHIANAHQLLCGMALGQQPAEGAASTKAEVIAVLEASNALCVKAYAMSDAESFKPLNAVAAKAWIASGFGTPSTQLHALTMNAWHDSEHYGNIVTYMRLKGMVPPSSQPKK